MAARTERTWVAGAALVAVLVALVGWFFLISPQRSQTADVQSRIGDTQLQNDTLQAQIARLGDEQKNWRAVAADLARTRAALPAKTDMAAFLRDIQTAATASQVTVTSLSVGTPAPLAAAVAPAAVTSGSASPAAASSAAPTPAGTTGPAAAGGMQQIPLTASVTGRAKGLTAFLTTLQTTLPRAVLVTEVARSAGTGAGGSSALQLTMQAFVSPATAAVPATAPTAPPTGH